MLNILTNFFKPPVPLARYCFDENNAIEIFKMKKHYIKEWHDHHIPLPTDNNKNDVWNWYKIYKYSKLTNLFGQQPKAYIFKLNDVLIGMMLVANKYSCYLTEERIDDFVWYVIKSPRAKQIIEHYECKQFSLLTFAFDFICKANKKQPVDTFWLHADPKGGDKLLRTYSEFGLEPCNFKEYVKNKRYTSRKVDDRYMYMVPKKMNIIRKTVRDDYVCSK